MEALSLPYRPFPSLIYALYTTSVSPDSRRLLDHSGSGKVQPSSPSKPSPSGFPLGGFRSPSLASRTKMVSVKINRKLTVLW